MAGTSRSSNKRKLESSESSALTKKRKAVPATPIASTKKSRLSEKEEAALYDEH